MKWIKVAAVLKKLSVSRPTLYRLMREEGFPQPIKLDAENRWLEAEVDDWMKQRVDALRTPS